MFRQWASKIFSRGLTPVRLVLVVLILGFTSALVMNAAVEDKMLFLESLQWLLGDVHPAP